MVAGGISSGAHIADHFALFHFLPHGHADGGTVCIQGFVGIVMSYLDVVSIPAAPRVDGVGNGDGSIRCGKDRRAARCADIGSVVVSDFPGEGILTVPKP